MSVSALFQQSAYHHAQRIALIQGDTRVTYQQLAQRVITLSGALRQRQKSAFTLVLLDESAALVTAALAIMQAGQIFVPLSPTLPPQRLQALLAQFPEAQLITNAQGQARARHLTGALATLIVDETGLPEQPADRVTVRAAEQNQPLAYVYFTSGSTGTPKAVLGRADSLHHFIAWESKELGITPDDRVSMLTSQMFDPFLRDMLLPLVNGATLCIPPSRELIYAPADLLRWMQTQRITVSHQIPSLLQVLLDYPEAAERMRTLRYILLAGEMLKGSLVARFYQHGPANTQLINLYGPTETTLAKLFHRVTPEDAARARVPVGHALPDVAIGLVDAAGEAVAAGESGEVIIATPWMSAGYKDHASAAFFTDAQGNRLYRTGDTGRLLASGELELLGRNDTQLKINGQRIETAEIEMLLEQHPAVQQAAVVAYAESQQLVAFVTLKSEPQEIVALLRDCLTMSLPAALLPTDYVVLELFPRLPNGKLDRKSLPKPALRGHRQQTAFSRPREGDEQALAAIWQRLLPVDDVARDDSFFALGGNSLSAMRMIACVRNELGRELAFADLLAQPTLAACAQALHQRSAQPDPAPANVTLSDAQQGIWLIQQQSPASSVWHLAYRAEWQGLLDLALLQQALDQALARHDALRTAFYADQKGVSAEINSQVALSIGWQDFSLQGENARAAAENWLSQFSQQPFDLTQAPLLRVNCARIGVDHHLAGVVCHHIIADAESIALLWQTLLADYGRLLAGKSLPPVSAVPCQRVHAQRQQQRLAHGRGESLRNGWRQRLAGPLPLMQLPYDFPVPALRNYRGEQRRFTLPRATAEALMACAARHGVTPYIVLLTLYTAFLARYSRQRDLIIGMPVSTRYLLDSEQAFGLLFNVVALRLQVDLQHSFNTLVKQVADNFIAAMAQQDLPFSQVLDALEEARHPGISPVFQTLFVWQQHAASATRLAHSDISPLLRADRGGAVYELTLEMWPDEQGITGCFEYATDRFLPDTIARMAANFTQFLNHCLTESDQALGYLPLLAEAERQQIWQWNQTSQPFSDDIGIHQLFERQVLHTPDAPAVEFLHETLTYRELDARANQLAHWLLAQGVGPEVAVGLCIERSLSLAIGFLAILKAGGVYVPIDPDYPQARSDYVIADADLRLMLTQDKFAERFACVRHSMKLFTVEAVASQLAGCSDRPPAPQASADNTAYIIYTSGSTGQPKGVPIRHRGICNLAETEVALLDMSPPARVLQFASFSFDTSVWEIVMTLCSGCTLVMAPALALLPGPDLLEQLAQRRISHVTLPASALAALPYAALPDLRVLIVAGEACGVDLLHKWGKNRRFINSYGPTETTVSATNAELTLDDSRVHIGRPVHNTQVWILDEFQQPLPIGVVGELYIGGIGVSTGYLNQPALTAERFIADPFSLSSAARLYRTGDLGCYRHDGNIDYLGRIDHQVKIRGYRVELGEIESALRRHPAVADAVTMVREDYLAGSAVVAYLLPKAGQQPERSALHSWLAAILPEFMCPSCYVMMCEFPRLPNNKIDRKRFPPPQPDSESRSAGEPPQGATEQAIVDVWRQMLGIAAIDRDASFFSLGGHSLLAARAVALLAEQYDLHLRVSDIFTCRTPRQLAGMVQNTQADSALLQQPARQDAPLSFAQQRMWFLEQLHPQSTRYLIGEIKHFIEPVTPQRLTTTLESLLRAFPQLNIRLRADGALPRQYQSHAPLALTVECVESETWQDTVQQRARALMAQPLPLLDAPLYRFCFIYSPQGECALISGIHHILVDEHTLALMHQHLAQLIRDPQAVWPPAAINYLQYAHWERSAQRQASLSWWRERFTTMPPTIALPQRAQPDRHDWQAAYQQVSLPDALTDKLRQLARQQDTTLFTLMLAAFQLLLQRYSGENDLTIGLPVSLRDSELLQKLPGLLLNTLAFRQNVDTTHTFPLLLAATENALRQTLAHKETPFEQVVNAVLPGARRTDSPLFNIMFVHQAALTAPQEADEAVINHQPLSVPQAKFDLTLFVQESATQLTLNIEYRAALYHRETIAAFAAAYEQLLTNVCQQPQRPVCQLEILDEPIRHYLLHHLAHGPTRAAAPLLQTAFEQQAALTPQAVALAWEEEQICYQQLNQQANQQAYRLKALNIGPGERVAVLLPRSPALICAILATVKSGAAWLAIDIAYPAERIHYMLNDACVAKVITSVEQAQRLALPQQQTLLLPPVMATLESAGVVNPAPAASAEDAAYLLYTSGTTGKPKGVVIPHRALANYLQHAQEHYDCPHGQGNTLHASISFDATLTSLFLPLLTGKTLFILPDEEDVPALLATWQQLTDLTMAKVTPAHLELLSQQLSPASAGHAATLVVGGESLAASTLRFWREHAPQVRVINEYGPTETTVGCSLYMLEAGACPTAGAIPIGRPIANMRIYLLDEHQQLTPPGAAGEIYIGGAGVALGYFNRPDLTASRFVDDPFTPKAGEKLYRTGDLARWLPDGNLCYLGRRDNQIKLRGHRIELEEVEAQLLACEGVMLAAAGVRQVNARAHLTAYITLASEARLERVRQQLAHQLPEIMRPTQWVILPNIPLTGNGKVNRAWLAQQPLQNETASPFRKAESETEQQLTRIWQTVLGGDTPGVDDDFFALGGDSILSLQMVFLAREAGLRLQARMLFDYPTIATLASVVEPLLPAEQGARPRLQGYNLLPAQRWFFSLGGEKAHHYNQSWLWRLTENVNLAHLEQATGWIVQQHEGLRARFSAPDAPATVAAPDDAPLLREIALSAPDNGEAGAIAWAGARQAQLDLALGPLFTADVIHADSGDYLLLSAHHLLVDGVSWRIIINDLSRAYLALAQGQSIPAQPATASLAEWSDWLQQTYDPAGCEPERQFWQAQQAARTTLPVDAGTHAVPGRSGEARKVYIRLDRAATQVLVRQTGQAYHTHVGDLLLAALAKTLSQWAGTHQLRIDLEGHGRDDAPDAPDVSRTVGWFTAIYPLALQLTQQAEWGDLLQEVKEAQRNVPRGGVGYGVLFDPAGQAAEVCFNYLGQFDNDFHQPPLDGVADLLMAYRSAPENRRGWALEVDSYIDEGELIIAWSYNPTCWQRETIAAQAEAMKTHLRALIDHCTAQTRTHWTPSDFPLAGLDRHSLQQLQQRHQQIADIYPLTPTQEGMLYHSLAAADAGLYHEQICFALPADVDVARLQRAWQRVVAGCPALRTTFELNAAAGPLQIVHQQMPLSWQFIDCRARQDDRLATLWQDDRQQGFDLRQGPLFRITVLAGAQGEMRMLFSHHHAILDGWSVTLLLAQVAAAYHQPDAALPATPSFRRYIAWQRRSRDNSLRHWQTQLSGMNTATPLPAVRPGGVPSQQRQRQTFQLDAAASARLIALGRRHRLTISTLVQGAWALLLQRYAGVTESLSGVTLSGRDVELAGIERMIGLLIGSVPLRVTSRPEQPVLDWLQAIQRQQLENARFSDISLADLKQACGLTAWPALFDTLVVFENYPQQDNNGLFSFVSAQESTNYALTLVAACETTLHGTLVYDDGLYSPQVVAQLTRHFLHILRQWGDAEQLTLAQVTLLDQSEQATLLKALRGPECPLPAAGAYRLFEQRASAMGDRIAVIDGDRRLTFAMLRQQAEQLSARLHQRGLGRGDRVALFLPRSANYLVAMLAASRIGVCYVPVDIASPTERIRYLLSDSQCHLVITQQEGINQLPADQPLFCMDETAAALPLPPVVDAADQLAYILYTSGSTGQPKGVMIEQRGLVNYLTDACQRYQVVAGMESLFHSSVSFDATLTSIWLPLLAGGTIVTIPGDGDLAAMARHLRRASVPQLLKITPVHLALLQESLDCAAKRRVSALVVGGEALSCETVQRWLQEAPETRIYNEYGPTETVVGCCMHQADITHDRQGAMAIGLPSGNTQLLVLNDDQTFTPPGAEGELYIAGAGVARGYWQRPALSAEKFLTLTVAGKTLRAYRSGDRVSLLPNGELRYHGRGDRQLKVRGYRIEPGEIEAQLMRYPGVRQCAVALLPGKTAEDAQLAAWIAPQLPGAERETLRAFLAPQLPGYMIPGLITLLPALPLTANGKVDYQALPRPAQNPQQTDEAAQPATPLESTIQSVWREVLQRNAVACDQNFFALGGHSLHALRVAARLEHQLNIQVSLTDLLNHQTVQQLAAVLAKRTTPLSQPRAITRVSRRQETPL